jgi:hypothetical protein
MSKSRSKGYIYGTPYIIRGDGGSRTIGILDRFGTHWRSATARRPEPRSGDGRNLPAQRAVTFMQQCIHNATVYRSRHPAREAGPKEGEPRSGDRGRDAAQRPRTEHARRTTYACTTQARLRQYVALTYRVPLISHRDS